MRLLLIIGVILLITSIPVFADDGVIERYKQFMAMVNTQYVDNASELPTDIDMTPNNSIRVQSSGHIKAQITIAGYKNIIKENGIEYIHGNPIDLAVVKYDIKANLTDCPSIIENGCGVAAIYKDTNISQSGNQIIARMDITLYWYYISCGLACIKIERHESASFFDYRTIPPAYSGLDVDTPIYVEIFNNTFEPKTTVVFKTVGASRVNVSYKNSSLRHYSKIIQVEYNNESIPYGNMTCVDHWNKTGSEVSHMGNTFVINGTAIPEDIIIEVSNPYETVKLTNYSVNTEKLQTFSSLFIPFALILIIIFGAISKILGAL